MAEALAVREALLHAKSLYLPKFCLCPDIQVMMNALTSKLLKTSHLRLLLYLLFLFLGARSMNSTNDAIAKSALCNHNYVSHA